MLNKSGARTQPCLKPMFVKMGDESSSALMIAEWLVRRSLMRATSFWGTPLLSKICQARLLSTESNAFVRSNMQMYGVLPLFQADSQTRRRLNKASAQLLAGLKPYCCSSSWSPRHSDRRALRTCHKFGCYHLQSNCAVVAAQGRVPLLGNGDQDVLFELRWSTLCLPNTIEQPKQRCVHSWTTVLHHFLQSVAYPWCFVVLKALDACNNLVMREGGSACLIFSYSDMFLLTPLTSGAMTTKRARQRCLEPTPAIRRTCCMGKQ